MIMGENDSIQWRQYRPEPSVQLALERRLDLRRYGILNASSRSSCKCPRSSWINPVASVGSVRSCWPLL